MKKNRLQDQFLAELMKVPIIQVACEKSGLSRQSVYRWKKEDSKFATKMDEALAAGIAFVNDMSESQLLTMIKEKNWPAISFWLKHHHHSYTNKLEVMHTNLDKELTKEQKEMIEKALALTSSPQKLSESNK